MTLNKEIKLYNEEGSPNSKEPHRKAQERMYLMVYNIPFTESCTLEKIYPNPWNRTGNPEYDWKFDVYFEYHDRKVAIEVDDKHKLTHRVIKSREHKINYLRLHGIELFAWPRKWIIGRDALDDDIFLTELRLPHFEEPSGKFLAH
jgi:hypothetical protein